MLFLFKLLAHFPLSAIQVLGAALGWLAYAFSGGYRRRMRAHIVQAGLDPNVVLHPAIAESGKQALETAWIWLRPRNQLARVVEWANPQELEAPLAANRPVMILTPHLGCFEAIAQSYAMRPEAAAKPMTALYRVPHKSALKPLAEGARAKENLLLAPADTRGVRMLMRALKANQVVGILPDQVPSQGEGVWAPFFGRPAYTMTLPARLARATGAVLLVLGAERLPGGRGFRIHIEPLTAALDGDPAHDAAAINRGIERMIVRFPAQYLWGYNRYKTPAGAAAAPGAGVEAQ